MGVNGFLATRLQNPVPIEQDATLDPEPVWAVWERDEFRAPFGNGRVFSWLSILYIDIHRLTNLGSSIIIVIIIILV